MSKRSSPNMAIRLEPEDKAMLEELSRRLIRSQTDTIRLLVRGAYSALMDKEVEKQPTHRTLTAA